MGWWTCEANREATPLLYFERHVLPDLSCAVLAYKAVGATIYGVTDKGEAFVCLVRGNCGHKLMSEWAGPVNDKCPKTLLEMLRWPAPSESAEQWRYRCAAHFKTAVRWNR